MTQTEKIFNLFTSNNDHHRPVFNKPFAVGNKVYATNTMTLIATDKKNIDFDYSNEHKEGIPKGIESVMPESILLRKLNFNPKYFEKFKTENEIIKTKDETPCNECYYGEVEWTYKNWTKSDTCPVCKGSEIKNNAQYKKTGNKTFGDLIVKVGPAYFHIEVFKVLFDITKELNEPIYVSSKILKEKALRLKIKNFDILLMPYTVENEKNHKIVKVKVGE